MDPNPKSKVTFFSKTMPNKSPNLEITVVQEVRGAYRFSTVTKTFQWKVEPEDSFL